MANVLRAVHLPKMAEIVAADLRGQIIEGQLREGDPLPPEDQLMEDAGVARTTVREALRILEGTPLYFSFCSFGFICIATIAFNLVGGLSRPSGGYIFFYAVLVVIFGISYKAYLGEPGDSNLLNPKMTMLAYLASISAMAKKPA